MFDSFSSEWLMMAARTGAVKMWFTMLPSRTAMAAAFHNTASMHCRRMPPAPQTRSAFREQKNPEAQGIGVFYCSLLALDSTPQGALPGSGKTIR